MLIMFLHDAPSSGATCFTGNGKSAVLQGENPQELLEEAFEILVPADGGEKDRAIECIRSVVELYQNIDGTEKPRVARVADQLLMIAKAADNLDDVLDQAGMTTIERLIGGDDAVTVLVDTKDPESGDGFFAQGAAGSLLRKWLGQLSSKATRAAEDLPSDRGGSGSVFPEPDYSRRLLAIGCCQIFEEFRTDRATLGNQDFRQFVSLAYELATGKQDADLERPIKVALRRFKKFPKPQ